MSKKAAALYSRYVIDGVKQDCTPAELLRPVCAKALPSPVEPDSDVQCIVDETADPPVGNPGLVPADISDSLSLVLHTRRSLPMAYMESYTRLRVAVALEDALWRKGRFRLGDLQLAASWRWNGKEVGEMAAFYASVRSAADYVDALGLRFSEISCVRTVSEDELSFRAVIDRTPEDDEAFILEPFRTESPRMSPARACSAVLDPDPDSWVIYIPFDTADFRLGGSLLAQAAGLGGAPADTGDADYFIDCFEVVREFVEDGLLLSAVSVGDGGLLSALVSMTCSGCGIEADISSVMHSYQEKQALRVLFAEVPGVVVQIRDSDFDYLDAELLLQDVAYFPLGHPSSKVDGVDVKFSEKSGIQTILESLIRNAEGED